MVLNYHIEGKNEYFRIIFFSSCVLFLESFRFICNLHLKYYLKMNVSSLADTGIKQELNT